MSMKLSNITERCPAMEPAPRPVKTFHKRRISVMQSIYALYIIQFINIIALIVLWVKVFFYLRGE